MHGNKMDSNGNESFPSLINYFAENTSMHGISRFIGKTGFFRRTFWVLAVLTGAGVAMYNIWTIGTAYSSWKVSTVIKLEYNSKLRFPAVTICNLNPVRKTSIDGVQAEFDDLKTALRYENNSARTRDEDFPDWGNSSISFDAYDSDHRTAIDFQKVMATTKKALKVQIGHQIQDMLLDCSFQGKVCTPSNFTHFYNYMHGNCYTFIPKDEAFTFISKTGPLYGLALMLYVEEEKYISSLGSSGVGFKVVVHNHNTMPFPEDEGFDTSPGFATSVGVTKVTTERVSAPYGNCKGYGSGVEEPPNIFTTQVPNITYSDQTCKKTCVQKMLVSECGCCNNLYPCDHKALSIINSSITNTVGFCILQDETKAACASAVSDKLENNQMFCPDSCDPNCKDESHQLEISTAMWPASSHLSGLVDTFIKGFTKRQRAPPINKNASADEKDDFFRRNMMRLNVFYKQLNYQKIQTKPAYDWRSLLSDVGGQAGLWLGFSLLTLAEILELIVDVVIHLCTKPFRSNKGRVNPGEKRGEVHF
ncbi:amiloride-sensitive sodium channel subunit gamma-like [Haliotis rufescens]|uniref:amiloride-sensitive sodium channel subunit gamma-like n=1 Tax=Haliotis rufescens TaxID=6454 RepID=UPI00201FAC89|nr:amiloride-sensitive sodium channel subunit gamma-like [Haliotis rufescens]